MKKYYKYILILFFIILPVFTFAKPRFVRLEKELKKAVFVGRVIVENYDENGDIYFHSIEFADTIKMATTSFSSQYNYPYDLNSYCTGSYPKLNDTVLIVIDSLNRVSLFAKIIEGNYRFWSPIETGSIALFEFTEPAIKLPFEKTNEKQGDLETCWDGCLLPVVCLNNYLLQQYTYTGYAITSNGKPLFVWDFADSQAFFLEGLTFWTEKYNNKKITVRGALVFEKGESILRDWEIK